MTGGIRRQDIEDTEIVDAVELASAGTTVLATGITVLSTTASTKYVVCDGVDFIHDADQRLEAGDTAVLVGTSGGLADGLYHVTAIIDSETFEVSEVIADSTGGTAEFRYPAGALKVGFDPTGLTKITSTTVQGAIEDLDAAHIAQVVTVAKSGGDFTSVKDALASITDASASKPYVIYVYPGVYVEDPITLKAYVNVHGCGTWLEVVFQTTDDSNHFITGVAGATLSDVAIIGPTGAGYAAIDYTGTGYTPFFLYHTVIRKGYYGLYIHPSSYGTVHAHELVNQYSGTQIEQFIRITNGNLTIINSSYMSGPSGSVVTCVYATGTTTSATLDLCAFRAPGSSDLILADDGALIRLTGTTLSAGTIGIRIGSTGTGTKIHAMSCLIHETDVAVPIQTDTPNCEIEFQGVAHADNFNIATGTTFVCQSSNGRGTTILGELYQGTLASSFPIGGYLRAIASTGVDTGWNLSRASGLSVSVSAGSGFITSGTGLIKVSWGANPTFPVSANKDNFWIIVDATGTLQETFTLPDETTVIALARGVTDATDVVQLATRATDLYQHLPEAHQYARDVVGPICVSGCVASKVTTPSLQLKVDLGTFYIFNNRRTAAAHNPITFTYWYRNSPSEWKFVKSQTAIDPEYYDNGSGTLAAVTAGKFKRDLVYLCVNGTGTEYHIVYGQQIFDTALLALSNPNPPDTLLTTALRLAGIIVQQGTVDINTVVDQLPKLGQLASGGTAVTAHGSLTGLSNDDHTQYQLRTEKGSASGYCGLDAGSKVVYTNLPLTSTPPADVTKATADVGSSNELARANHKHDITTAAPVSIGTANTEGSGTTLARSSHVHDHGAQTSGTLHAVATTSVAGFESAADKTKLDALISRTYDLNSASEGQSTTTSGTPQQKLRLTTASLPAGTYKICWYYEWRGDSTSDDFLARVQINDTTSIHEVNIEPKDTTNYGSQNGFYFYTGSGVLNIDLDYWAENAATSYIRKARLCIQRTA
jgi:hypothetical protein